MNVMKKGFGNMDVNYVVKTSLRNKTEIKYQIWKKKNSQKFVVISVLGS